MKRRRLQILEPCSEDFASMRGSERARFCDKCDKNVHDLSAMTSDDADALLAANAGAPICIRMTHDAKGEVKHRVNAVRRAGFVAAIAFAMAACTGHGDAQELDSPDSTLVCHDANGYAIRCEDADEWFAPDELDVDAAPAIARADIEPESEAEVHPVIETVDPAAERDETIEVIELVGQYPQGEPEVEVETEGPLDEEFVTMGVVAESCPVGRRRGSFSYNPDRASRRVERQEARADRKRDRQARRRIRKERR